LPFTFFREDAAATPRVNESEPAAPQRPESEDARPTAEVLLGPENPEPPARPETTRPEARPAPSRSVLAEFYLEPEPAADAKDAPQLAPPQPASPSSPALTSLRPTTRGRQRQRGVGRCHRKSPQARNNQRLAWRRRDRRSQASPGIAQGALIEAKMRWANASVRSACDLGERRLLYSTRAKLQDALYQIAQSLDESAGTKQHAARPQYRFGDASRSRRLFPSPQRATLRDRHDADRCQARFAGGVLAGAGQQLRPGDPTLLRFREGTIDGRLRGGAGSQWRLWALGKATSSLAGDPIAWSSTAKVKPPLPRRRLWRSTRRIGGGQ